MSVSKVDGIGTRKDGTGGEDANLSQGNKRIIRMIGFCADSGSSVTYTKGDTVALQLSTATVNGSNVIEKNGAANVIKLATDLTETAPVGIVTETVTATISGTTGTTVIVPVQISGVFASANVATHSAIGEILFCTATDGRISGHTAASLTAIVDVHKPVAICLGTSNGTAAAASNLSDVLLLNPMDY